MSYVMLWYRKGSANYVGSLMDYVARGYSPALGRFISADTIVPGAGNPAALNRYMYVGANPLGRIDPSGHAQLCGGTADDGLPTVCTATGDTLKWEQWLKSKLAQSNLGKEMLDNDPELFERILWVFSILDFGASASNPGRVFGGGTRAYVVELTPGIRDKFSKSGNLNDVEVALVAHEVFHAYQRRRDPARDTAFTTLQMEREASAFGWGVRYGITGGYQNEDQRDYLESPGKAYSKIKATPYVFAWIAYNTAKEETTHNGDLISAFTVDLSFSPAALLELYGAAGRNSLPATAPGPANTPR